MHARRWPRFLFYAIAIFIIALDQLTKAWATASLEPVERITLVPGYLDFSYLTGGNTGIAFGLFQGQRWLVALFMIALAALALYYAREINWAVREPNVVGGGLVGGALGNMLDRIRLGHVVDFVDFHLGAHHWPTFNLADSVICISVAWIVVRQLRSGDGAKVQRS